MTRPCQLPRGCSAPARMQRRRRGALEPARASGPAAALHQKGTAHVRRHVFTAGTAGARLARNETSMVSEASGASETHEASEHPPIRHERSVMLTRGRALLIA